MEMAIFAPMDGDGHTRMDLDMRTEFSRLRTEMQETEQRLMGHLIWLSWRWVIAIYLASLALAAAILGSILDKS